MEKSARQALLEGVADTGALRVSRDSELFRALNTHYNKGNDFEVRRGMGGRDCLGRGGAGDPLLLWADARLAVGARPVPGGGQPDAAGVLQRHQGGQGRRPLLEETHLQNNFQTGQ